MSFNFPDNPTQGQIFEPTAGTIYIWQSPAWKRYVPPGDEEAGIEEAPIDGQQYARKDTEWEVVYVPPDIVQEAPIDDLTYGRKNATWATVVGGAVISDGPPPGPLQAGQLWYEADSGNTYIWYSDADSSQWVQVNIQPPGTTAVPPGLTANVRNRIVNGAMQISQELGSGGSGVNGSFTVDQFMHIHNGLGTISAAPTNTTPNGTTAISTWIGTAKPSLAAGDYWFTRTPIEGIRVKDFQWGTASAKAVVLRFWAWGQQAGTYSIKLTNAAVNRTFLATYTLAASTWKEIVIPIPGDTTGTWPTDNTLGFYLEFFWACGTPGGAVGWNAGNIQVPPGVTNGAATIGSFRLGDVGLYLDPLATGVAPRWEMPDETAEILTCRRYYEKTRVIASNYNYLTNVVTTKRTAPALSTVLEGGTGGAFSWLSGYGENSFYQNVVNSGAAGAIVTMNARM